MRPLAQGEAATSRDVETLLRISRRIEADPERPQKEKDELIAGIKAVVTILLGMPRARRKPGRAA